MFDMISFPFYCINTKTIDTMKSFKVTISLLLISFAWLAAPVNMFSAENSDKDSPCIINFINFIRQTEPRWPEDYPDEYLFNTTVEELKQLNEFGFKGTFLIQYDALINPDYQELMKKAIEQGHEVGAWWEITEPHVKDAGMNWRGRFPWDWHANVGFATGYTPDERIRLVDVYMEKFHSIFGCYPASVGSWFIDAHTMGYLYDRYNVKTACMCRDQYGTDGYTLWGGYWNQAYYPSRLNSYMPAQTQEEQIPIPVFRMLGSDPIYQYDSSIGNNGQGVITLEPIYKNGGGNRRWVEWFFPAMAGSKSINFNYIQAGQENSFGWNAIRNGLTMQVELVRGMADEGLVRVETLGESGSWYKKNFPVTPATAVTVMDDYRGKDISSVWYNSRFYRAGLLWIKNKFVIRDIHMFDAGIESDYLRKAGTTTYCEYITPPFVDGFLWSTKKEKAGLRLVAVKEDGTAKEISVKSHEFVESGENALTVNCNTAYGQFSLLFEEDAMTVAFSPADGAESLDWALEFTAVKKDDLPFTKMSDKVISASHRGYDYDVNLIEGKFVQKDSDFAKWHIVPQDNRLVLSGVIAE